MEKLWTTSEVAKCLGIPDGEVQRLVQQGELTGYKLGGQFLRFRPEQVQQLKGKLRVRSAVPQPSRPKKLLSLVPVRDFLYFNDFYIVSAMLLALLVVYLIASG